MEDRRGGSLADVLGADPDALIRELPEAITIQDRTGALVYANESAAALLGFDSPEQLLEAGPAEVLRSFEFTDQDGRPVPLEGLLGTQVLEGGEPEELLVRVCNRARPEEEERWRMAIAFPLRTQGGGVAFAVNVFRDVTEQKRSEVRLRAQFEVTQVLATATTLDEAAPRILRSVGHRLGWDVGILWRVDEPADVLRYVAAWHGPERRGERFVERCRDMTFSPGAGLPGRVWRSCQTVWMPDVQRDQGFRRRPIAESEGLHGAFAFPIVRADEVVGVVEFLSRETRRPDDELLEMMAALGVQVGQFIDRHQAEEDRRFLVEATDVLTRSLDYEHTLGEVAALAIPRLADVCIVYMAEEDGAIRRVAIRQSSEMERKLERQLLEHRLQQEFPFNPEAEEGVPKVLRTGRSELRRDADFRLLSADVEKPERLAAFLEPLGIRSWICVPMVARGRTLGAISFVSAGSGRQFDRTDLALAEELGRRAAMAVDNARLFQQAEQANERLAYLAEVSRSLSASLNYRRTLSKVARLAVPRLADWCLVDVVGEDGSVEMLSVAHVDPEKVRLARRLRRRYPPDMDGARGVGRVLRTGRSELYERITDELLAASAADEEHLSLLRQLQLRSAMTVPLSARGRVLGAVTMVAAESGRIYGPEDLRLAEEVASRAAVAIDNARLYEERSSVARTLQQTLLPPDLPALPGVELAASYRPAAAGEDIGGDFYDVFQLAEGEWALVIGDVCGKGVDAAALTGLARHTIRATATQGLSPTAILGTLNEVIRRERSDAGFCTVAYARLRFGRSGGELTVVCGGHPSPFLLRARGAVETVGRPGTLVGVLPAMESHEQTIALTPGDAVVLYTDGVTDQRANGDLFGEERLRRVLRRSVSLDARSMVQRVERAIDAFTTEPPRDDMALLVLRLVPT